MPLLSLQPCKSKGLNWPFFWGPSLIAMRDSHGGGGCGFLVKQARRIREVVDIFGKKWTYLAPPPVIALLRTAPLLDQLTSI